MVEVSIHRARLNAYYKVVVAAHALIEELDASRAVSLATRNDLVSALRVISETPDDGWEPWDISGMFKELEDVQAEAEDARAELGRRNQELKDLVESWEQDES